MTIWMSMAYQQQAIKGHTFIRPGLAVHARRLSHPTLSTFIARVHNGGGAGHSFGPLATTDDVLVNLIFQGSMPAALQGPHGGAPVYQALQNQGDIDHQSLAGVVATGTMAQVWIYLVYRLW